MLHVYIGEDIVRARKAAHACLGGREAERIVSEGYEPGLVRALIHDQSLFGSPAPVLLDMLSENSQAWDEVQDLLPHMAASGRTFVLIDGGVTAALRTSLKKHATTFEETKAITAGARFNTFALADALARKDKKSLWILIVRAQEQGVPSEEIAGVLFWQLKALRLALDTQSAAEAGMKEFPYSKAKAAAKKFSKEELRFLSRNLLAVYHEGHAETDMAVGLERFVLSMK